MSTPAGSDKLFNQSQIPSQIEEKWHPGLLHPATTSTQPVSPDAGAADTTWQQSRDVASKWGVCPRFDAAQGHLERQGRGMASLRDADCIVRANCALERLAMLRFADIVITRVALLALS